jgi:hypothetical protein
MPIVWWVHPLQTFGCCWDQPLPSPTRFSLWESPSRLSLCVSSWKYPTTTQPKRQGVFEEIFRLTPNLFLITPGYLSLNLILGILRPIPPQSLPQLNTIITIPIQLLLTNNTTIHNSLTTQETTTLISILMVELTFRIIL